MYTFSEIQKIFNSCKNWIELEKVSQQFQYLLDQGWIKTENLTRIIYECCDAAFRRIENL